MKSLAPEGRTMMVVAHEMSFAREVADRVVFMDGGVIVEDGLPAQVIGAPTQQRTGLFLSCVLNFTDPLEETGSRTVEAGSAGGRAAPVLGS